MMRRLIKLTPLACLDATHAWLIEHLGLTAQQRRLFDVDSMIWMEFSDVRGDEFSEEPPIPTLRGVLFRKIPTDMEASLTSSAIVLTLHEKDPTPRVTQGEDFTSTQRNLSGYRLVLFATPDGVIARDILSFHEDWGARARWPFDD